MIGIVLVTIGYTELSFKCEPTIEYRYIPRKIYEEQLYDQNVEAKFASMFNDDNRRF
jgi:hypothetical protein|tara:strand:- start:42 stop:212 length:171 start_codon:yes stop_codon:yes gene_type:complete